MKTKILMTAAALGCGLLNGPASAQLLGGGLGGAVGGALGRGPMLNGSIAGNAQLGLDARDTTTVVSRTRDAMGNVTTTTRDARGRLLATTRDLRGHVISRAAVTVQSAQSAVANAAAVAPSVVAIVPPPPVAVDVRRREAIVASGVAVIPERQADIYIDREVLELQQGLAGTGVEVVRRGQEIALILPSDVTFAFDKSDIQPKFFPVLNEVARALNRYPSTFVDISGHTDAIGSLAYNQRLSERRADTVASYLTGRGALPDRLYARGFGKTEPIASNSSIEGRAANRRVEIDLRPVVG